jgi:hypothetical protein
MRRGSRSAKFGAQRAAAALAAVLASACVGPTDDPSQVHDLRVLAAQAEPPELQATSCTNDPAAQFPFLRPVRVSWLIADPNGEGRELNYTVTACANVGDRKCDNENDFIELAAGTTLPGTLEHTFALVGEFKNGEFRPLLLPDEVPLLQETISQDTYKGLGGVRMPLVLRIQGGDEIIYAQKLMVFSCKFFADQKPNVNPQLAGFTLDGQDWGESTVRTLSGDAPFVVQPVDFADREEPYIVPSFGLEPVYLQEAWKVSWHATAGQFSSSQTGGVDFSGEGERHRNEWALRAAEVEEGVERDITFTFVARDGRGGISWAERKAKWVP